MLHRFVPFLQRITLIVRRVLQFLTFIAHIIGTDLLAVILRLRVLEGDFVHADMLCFLDDRILDLAELLLLR